MRTLLVTKKKGDKMWSEMMGREVKLCSQLASHINQPRAIEQWVFFELLGLVASQSCFTT